MGDAGPVRQVMDDGVRHDGLGDDERGQNVKIRPVHFAVDDHVAEDTEKNQNIDTGIEKIVGKEPLRKTAERGRGQSAGGHEHEAAMELRFLAPVNRESEGAGEADHIQERNHEKRFCVRDVHLQGIEAAHDDGGGDSDDENQHTQCGSEPPDAAMPSHVVRSHQRGLQNEKQQPSGKDRGMDVQDGGRWDGRMNQSFAHGEAEAVHNHCGNQERHEEVEILIEQTATFRGEGARLKKARIGSSDR